MVATGRTKRQQNLTNWILRQEHKHRQRVDYEVGSFEAGVTLKLAKARIVLVRSDFVEEEKEILLKKIDWMLGLHADAAETLINENAMQRWLRQLGSHP
jgi:hypothetical protein